MRVTHERLIETLSYDPNTGHFFWKQKRWGGPIQGSRAGTVNGSGYEQISIDGKTYLSARLAFFYVHKRWPTPTVDHENTIRTDNRIDNLREATRAENSANRRRQKNNNSGFKGVRKRDPDHRYRKTRYEATITVANKSIYLGTFTTAESAADAYAKAAEKHFNIFARTE